MLKIILKEHPEKKQKRQKQRHERRLTVNFKPHGKGARESKRRFYKRQVKNTDNIELLKAIAKQLKLSGYARLDKDQLCNKLLYELRKEYTT